MTNKLNIFLFFCLSLFGFIGIIFLSFPMEYFLDIKLAQPDNHFQTILIICLSFILLVAILKLVLNKHISHDNGAKWISILLSFFAFLVFVLIIKLYFVETQEKAIVVDQMINLTVLVFVLFLVVISLFKNVIKKYNKLISNVLAKVLFLLILSILLITVILYFTTIYYYATNIINKLSYLFDSSILYYQKLLDNNVVNNILTQLLDYVHIIFLINSILVISVCAVILIIEIIRFRKREKDKEKHTSIRVYSIDEFLLVIKTRAFGFLYKTLP